jgi:hypothetical protein
MGRTRLCCKQFHVLVEIISARDIYVSWKQFWKKKLTFEILSIPESRGCCVRADLVVSVSQQKMGCVIDGGSEGKSRSRTTKRPRAWTL